MATLTIHHLSVTQDPHTRRDTATCVSEETFTVNSQVDTDAVFAELDARPVSWELTSAEQDGITVRGISPIVHTP